MATFRKRHRSQAIQRATHMSAQFDATSPVVGGLYSSESDIEPSTQLDTGAGSVGAGAVVEGSLPAASFDPTPPAVPTGLSVLSDVAVGSDGASIVRLIVTLTHPTDSDYFGSWIEATRDTDGADPAGPDWTQPLKLLLGSESTSVAFEGVAGSTTYWVRAYSVDVQGNKSAYTSTVAYTTVQDNQAPPMPEALVATAGFRGVALRWNAVGAEDLMFYQVRWGTDGSTFPEGLNAKVSVVWVPDLTPDILYYFQVRSVDVSGNTLRTTTPGVPDVPEVAERYESQTEAGWTTSVTATPTQVGSADIAANTITSAMIATGGLTADVIKAGTLTIAPNGAATPGAVAITIRDSTGVVQGEWHPTNGIKIYAADPSNYCVIDDAYIRFYKASILTAEMGPDGVKADSLRLGVLAGGHNLIPNSSFELGAFITGAASAVFTNNSGTPGWKAANRFTSPDNMSENANDLTVTALSF